MEALVGKLMIQSPKCLSKTYCCSLWLQNKSCRSVGFRRVVPWNESISLSLVGSSGFLLWIQPVSAVLSPDVASPEADYDNGNSYPLLGDAGLSKSVRVKFVLQKNCLFGQHFLLVGDNPILGLWDPTKAIPLEWSEDHIWTAELDLPVGETVQFKFILRGLSGQIHWQPGPDRILQTWDTTKTIIVKEEWDNAADQKIYEDEESGIWTEETPITEEKTEDHLISNDTSTSDIQGLIGTELQDDKNLDYDDDEGDLLLVPGLTLTTESGSSVEIQKVASSDVGFGSDSVKDHNSVQLVEKEDKNDAASENLIEEETVIPIQVNGDFYEDSHTTVQIAEKIELKEENSKPTSSILNKDFQWGRKFVENLLYNLGFDGGSTETS